jgi:flagellar hook-basal body complex protein FliE
MNPISASTSVPRVRLDSLPSAAPKSAEADKSSFNGLVEGLVNKINSPHVEAEIELAKLASGTSDSVHSAVLSMVKADMSFRMALEVRNRLTEAYQEIMRMQI